MLILVLVVIVGVLGVIGLSFKVYDLARGLDERNSAKEIDHSTYQAVFLTNDQIYFGVLKNIDSLYPVLTDVYYVQLSGTSGEGSGQGSTPSGKIVPLGKSEPHGPTSKMIINRDHILFIENLRPDSSVLRIIQGLKSQD